ncbi:hypothetical protein DM02DRAFT_629843 [Periconia macrospinosa]|uniref:Uncharacterized protein n=1 Tax=Periconia macrospinosa TaxID=97972 RepID=A0A2V1DLM0_9PLEO|nr:hypothetical protein DM02DRAFT_629843 [Periconia macrospinosa]
MGFSQASNSSTIKDLSMNRQIIEDVEGQISNSKSLSSSVVWSPQNVANTRKQRGPAPSIHEVQEEDKLSTSANQPKPTGFLDLPAGPDRSPFSLSQVCKQLRQEFPALNLVTISIPLPDVEKFIQAFRPSLLNLKTPTTIIVDIKEHFVGPAHILPLLLLTINRENIKIQFQGEGSDIWKSTARALNRAFCQRPRQWEMLTQSNVSEIDLYLPAAEFRIIFNHGGFDKWIEDRGIAPNMFWRDLGFSIYINITVLAVSRKEKQNEPYGRNSHFVTHTRGILR